MSYTNILNMLDLAGVPLRAADRTELSPLVVAGGPCCSNAEPIADFFDLFYTLYTFTTNIKTRAGANAHFCSPPPKLRGYMFPRFMT